MDFYKEGKKACLRDWKSCKSGVYYYDMSEIFAPERPVGTLFFAFLLQNM